jgi:hypothetical protein
LSVELARAWPARPTGSVWKRERETRGYRLRCLPPEAQDLETQDLGGLLVALPVARQSVESHGLAIDDAARAPVHTRPTERLDADRDNWHALSHRDHARATMHRARVAETLTRPLDEHADYVPLPHELARRSQALPVAFAAPDRKAPRPA